MTDSLIEIPGYDYDCPIRFDYDHRPIIKIRIDAPDGSKSTNIDALIDSGADCTTISYSVGLQLGHDIEKIKKGKTIITSSGVAGQLTVYPHSSKVYLLDEKNQPLPFLKPLEPTIYFSRHINIKQPPPVHPPLLGRDGFFDYFHITFYTYRGKKHILMFPKKNIVI